MNHSELIEENIAKVVDILENISEINRMIELHEQDSEDDFMVKQYKFKKEKFLLESYCFKKLLKYLIATRK